MQAKWIYAFLVSIFFSNLSFAQNKNTTMLFPWLAKSEKFGYCDSAGTLIIAAKFDYAGSFKNGYAVVGVKNSYGVLNEEGKIIIPIKYPKIESHKEGRFKLLVLKKEYNAWWRFWDWRILPGFNILSTSNSGPFLVTKVPMASWTIVALPRKKSLFTTNRSDVGSGQYWKDEWSPDSEMPRDISISSAGGLLLVDNKLYRLDADNRLKKIMGNVFDIIDSENVVTYKRTKLHQFNLPSATQNNQDYLMVDSMKVNVESNQAIEIGKKREDIFNFSVITTDLFRSQNGKTYFFPDLEKPFPVDIAAYKSETVKFTASDIINRAFVIASIPDTKYFLIISSSGKPEKRLHAFFLDTDGKWNTDIPAYEGFDRMLGTGEMLFTRREKKGILTKDLKFKAFPFDRHAYRINFSQDMFLGKDDVSKKYGIYNISKENWQVTALYSFLSVTNTPRIAIYSVTKIEDGISREKFGLLDIETNAIITPALYNNITEDCYVQKIENEQELSFYINPLNGKEYRE